MRGKLTKSQLFDRIGTGDIETVILAFPDLYGRLMGKRIAGPFFVSEVAEHGVHMCDYLLTVDMEMDPVPGYEFASWEEGYGDFLCVPDWNSLRVASWLDRTAILICDPADRDGNPVSVAPRNVLKRQVRRALDRGFLPMGAVELEMFVFRESYRSAYEKGYRNLQTSGWYIEDYHIFQGSKWEPLIGAIRHHLEASGIPVENSKGEWGPGQHEINIRYSEMVEMADRGTVFKEACKEIAHQQGLAVTFMAKWNEELAGNGMHIHGSLWDLEGKRNLFAGDEKLEGVPSGVLPLFRWYLGGLLAHTYELFLFFATNVNSYRRYQPGSFAPTGIAWSYDNRTAGYRVVGRGNSLRVESRLPGADANPYLALAATLAAGLDGIENKIEPPPVFRGDVYAAKDVRHVPRTLPEAIEAFENSDFARKAFGDDVVRHYVHFARTEQEKFDKAVTDWELRRYFERV